jgi:hypothetical protein
MKRVQAALGRFAVRLVLLCCVALPNGVLAGEKQYPLIGNVTTLATNQEIMGADSAIVPTHAHRTYTVKTPTRVFVLECPYGLGTLLPPHECGGKTKIAIGDTIHFRVHERYAYVQTDRRKEQRLAVLSEAVNEAGEPAAAKQP